jgi:hypothetical protein
MDEQSYVIHIYRRELRAESQSDAGDRRRQQQRIGLIGTVDLVECGERRAFS